MYLLSYNKRPTVSQSFAFLIDVMIKAAVSAKQANDLAFNIFSSAKSRTTFSADFGKMDRAEKCKYVQDFFNRTPFSQQEEILDVLTNSFLKNTTLNASRQSGKCVEEDTWITLGDGSVERIKNLPVGIPIEVATVHENRITKAIGIVTKTGQKEVTRTYGYGGNFIDTSEDHRFYHWNTKRHRGGHRTRRGFDYQPLKDLPLFELIAKTNSLENLCSQVDYPVSDDILSFLGLHLADGGSSCDIGLGTRKTPMVVAEMEKVSHTIRFTLVSLDLLDKDCYTKFVPPFLFKCSKRQIGLFLNRFFACDGYATNNEKYSATVGYCLCNERLATQLKALLKLIGIDCSLRHKKITLIYKGEKKKFKGYEATVNCNHENLLKFQRDVDILSKESLLQKCLDQKKNDGKSPRYENSKVGNLRFLSICKKASLGSRECYDISILPESYISETYEPNFIANGYVVHNSEAITWAQGFNAIHNLYPSLDGSTKIVSLANKESQSMIVGNRLRLLMEENWKHTQFFYDRLGSTKMHQVFKREAGINSKQTGTIDYLTANPKAFGEGFSASEIFIDEAGRLDQTVFSQVIVPYGGSANAKLNLTGVSRGRGPLYDACNSKDYTHLHYPWDKVGTYRRSAPADLVDTSSGRVLLETGLYPLKVMPYSLKKIFFPTNPMVHILPTTYQKEEKVLLWDLSEGLMSEEDFRTQYALEWLAALMAILQLEHCMKLFESGDFLPPDHGMGEEYYYGYDLGGSRNLYATGQSKKDTAALSIWRRRDGIKEKVFCDELYSAQPEEATAWLLQYVHPDHGIFPCKFGTVDVTGAIGALTSKSLMESRLPVIPIMYNRTEELTKKNFKNAMFDYFKIEVGGGRCRYPKEEITDALDPDTLLPKNPTWFKAREQWEVVERKDTGGINAQISAPPDKHDDHPNSDVLAIFGMDFANSPQFHEFLHTKKPRARRAQLGQSLMNRGGVMTNFHQQTRPAFHRDL
jgi:hypothetical protein